MFAYCLNNPVNGADQDGHNTEAVPLNETIPLSVPIDTLSVIEIIRDFLIVIGVISEAAAVIEYASNSEAEKADAKLKVKIKSKPQEMYWTATINKKGFIDIGRPLTFSQAVAEVQSGRNVIAATWFQAKKVARVAGGRVGYNNTALTPEINAGMENTPGYYYHYHTYNRKGGHVFFLFPL